MKLGLEDLFRRNAQDMWQCYRLAEKIEMLLQNKAPHFEEEALASSTMLMDKIHVLYKRFERGTRREAARNEGNDVE